jgi:hypothetical protein
VAAENEALKRLRAANHIGGKANTLDKSEKLDTVNHEHDEKGRTYIGFASKGVAGHALYSSGGQMISKGTLWPENPSTLTLVSAGEYIIVCTMENGRKQVIRQVVM